jgi:hypothetical protein
MDLILNYMFGFGEYPIFLSYFILVRLYLKDLFFLDHHVLEES